MVLARWFLASLKALDTKHPQRPFAQSHDDRLECPPLQSWCCAASLPCFQVPRIVLTIAHTVHGSSRVIRYCQDRWYRPQARSRMSLTLHEKSAKPEASSPNGASQSSLGSMLSPTLQGPW